MCCFSGTAVVERVAATQIFARPSENERQILVYSMNLAARADVAVLLPLPVPPRSAEDAVRFIDLEAYPDLFTDLRRGFPEKVMIPPVLATP